jgi:hypothetical protein
MPHRLHLLQILKGKKITRKIKAKLKTILITCLINTKNN